MKYLLFCSVIFKCPIQWYSVTGQDVEAIQPEETLHAETIPRRYNYWSTFGTFARYRIEEINVVVVWKQTKNGEN